MPQPPSETARGTCFVVMGFGKKTDFETGRVLDLDKTYKNIIKPAAERAGLRCVRADDIVHTGPIDEPMYEQLLKAEVVIADLSTSNWQVYYQLGVRHALRPHTTIVICEDGVKSFPFDLHHIRIEQYHHMGHGIDFDEVDRFRNVLSDGITWILDKTPRPVDSPVYTFLNGLTPPAPMGTPLESMDTEAPSAPVGDEASEGASGKSNSALYARLIREAEEAQRGGESEKARMLLLELRKRVMSGSPEEAEDPHVIRRIAAVTYMSPSHPRREALEEARTLLARLNPATTNDTETLVIWGEVHQHMWNLDAAPAALEEAVRAFDRAFYLSDDYRIGNALAWLLNTRVYEAEREAIAATTPAGAVAHRAAAVADFVQAGRFRRAVLKVCEGLLEREKMSARDRFNVLSAMAEAYVGVGDEERAQRTLEEVLAAAPDERTEQTVRERVDGLRKMLADSPLKYVAAEAA